MRSWSIPAGRIFGVEIRIHLTFLLLLAYVVLTEGAAGGAGAGRAVALVGIIFVSVVIHELAHALAALHSGRPAKSVILLPLGGVTLMDETAPQDRLANRELRIAAAGPLINLLIAFVAGAVVGAVIPSTGKENELLGEQRDRLVDRASSLAHERVERAKELVREDMRDIARP